MDLFGPSWTMSLGGNYYGLVILDESRYKWILFIVTKDDTFTTFKRLTRVFPDEKNCNISAIKTNYRGEFQNKKFESFYDKFGIKHYF